MLCQYCHCYKGKKIVDSSSCLVNSAIETFHLGGYCHCYQGKKTVDSSECSVNIATVKRARSLLIVLYALSILPLLKGQEDS